MESGQTKLGLKEYLEKCNRRGYKLFVAHSLRWVVENKMEEVIFGHVLNIDGKDIELSDKSYNEFKKFSEEE